MIKQKKERTLEPLTNKLYNKLVEQIANDLIKQSAERKQEKNKIKIIINECEDPPKPKEKKIKPIIYTNRSPKRVKFDAPLSPSQKTLPNNHSIVTFKLEEKENVITEQPIILRTTSKILIGEPITETFQSEEINLIEQQRDILKSKPKKNFKSKIVNKLNENDINKVNENKRNRFLSKILVIQTITNNRIVLPHKIRNQNKLYGKNSRYCRLCKKNTEVI